MRVRVDRGSTPPYARSVMGRALPCMFVTFVLTTLACKATPRTAPRDAQAGTRDAAPAVDEAAIQKLVDALASTCPQPQRCQVNIPLSPGEYHVHGVTNEIVGLGPAAFPVLLRNLDDARTSRCFTLPRSVGETCRQIFYSQVLCGNCWGYDDPSPYFGGAGADLGAWWQAHKHRSLLELQIDSAEWALRSPQPYGRGPEAIAYELRELRAGHRTERSIGPGGPEIPGLRPPWIMPKPVRDAQAEEVHVWDRAKADSLVDKWVVVSGRVGKGKVPTLDGLILWENADALRNRDVRLRGLVEQHVTTEEGARRILDCMISTPWSRPGVYYLLTHVEVLSGRP
jgi:hypothetical protein